MSSNSKRERAGRGHPGIDVLAQFIGGRLDEPSMAAVERHVDECETCCKAILDAPEDPLAKLLRIHESSGATP